MTETVIHRAKKLQGCLTMPGDKSISHRAALISLLCKNQIEITNYADGEDCQRSLTAVQMLGGTLETNGSVLRLTSPVGGMKSPSESIDCGNSGTTMRLLAGLLAGSKVSAKLIGDESLSRRPMDRLTNPLKQMNASVTASAEGTAPLEIVPAMIIPLDYTLPAPSAQIKSALLLAGLAAGTAVAVKERIVTRDHTERMIKYYGGALSVEEVGTEIVADPEDPRKKKRVRPTQDYRRAVLLAENACLSGQAVVIPGDISTAAFFITAALMIPGSHLIIKEVGLNPTRTAFITVLKQMGAEIDIKNRKNLSGEPAGDIEVKYSSLKPRRLSGDTVTAMIDEIPVFAVLASRIEGTTIVRDAADLRIKECDRIKAIVENLSAMGAKVGEFPDGFAIEGRADLNGAKIDSFGDHRIAMAFAVAGLSAHGQTTIMASDCVDVSCPRFFAMLEGLRV